MIKLGKVSVETQSTKSAAFMEVTGQFQFPL